LRNYSETFHLLGLRGRTAPWDDVADAQAVNPKGVMMKYLKIVVVGLVASLVVGVMAASVFGLPDISITLGGAYPIHLERTLLSTKSALENTSGEKLPGEGVLVLILAKELTSLGPFEALFLNVGVGKRKCATTGDSIGEVLTKGTWHIVLGTNGTKKVLSTLFEFEEVRITCPAAEGEGELKLKVKGLLLSPFSEEGTEATEFQTILLKLEGDGKGKQAQTKYVNDSGVEVTSQLLSNFGNGFIESNEVLVSPKEVTLLTLEGKMFVITGR
jgi:hypothetical protein